MLARIWISHIFIFAFRKNIDGLNERKKKKKKNETEINIIRTITF